MFRHEVIIRNSPTNNKPQILTTNAHWNAFDLNYVAEANEKHAEAERHVGSGLSTNDAFMSIVLGMPISELSLGQQHIWRATTSCVGCIFRLNQSCIGLHRTICIWAHHSLFSWKTVPKAMHHVPLTFENRVNWPR